MRVCTIEGCGKKHQSKGFCVTHYTRYLRYGDPHYRMIARGDAADFFAKAINAKSDECILWPYTTSGRCQRPWIKHKGARGYAARFMCAEVNGPPEHDGLHAAHSCGNLKCINPRHIRWATAVENAADKVKHGTAPRGENQGASKLKEWQISEIRMRKESVKSMSEKYGVSKSQIYRILNGDRWAYIGT